MEEWDAREFADLIALESVNPMGDRRVELMVARLCALIGNVHKKRGAVEFTEKDFLTDYGAEPKSQSADDVRTLLRGLPQGAGKFVTHAKW